MIKTLPLEQLQRIIANGESCIINLTANWCSDCTDQAEHLTHFCELFAAKQIRCYTLAVQDEKNIYLSLEHQAFTELVGGHGFPRTVLIIKGKAVDTDNVEIISAAQLTQLAETFLQQL